MANTRLAPGTSDYLTWTSAGIAGDQVSVTAQAQSPVPAPAAAAPSRKQLREQRLDELLTSCRERSLDSIIGPFGLNQAMFDDKRGGNVTTQRNAEQGIFAKESEEFKRTDYDYGAAKEEIKQELRREGSLNSQEFTDAYTKQKAPTMRTDSNGKLVMNAELDHLVPVKDIHSQGGWMRDKKGRTELSSIKDNLQYTTHETNRSKGARDPEQFLTAENGFDESTTAPLIEKAQAAIDEALPSTGERVVYHGKELFATGASEAGKMALRQAMGVLLFEFVNGSYNEIAVIAREPDGADSLVDRLIAALRRVMERVQAKMRDAFKAFASGGVEGFVGNFLTFVINHFVTTSAKLVSVIRESIKGLWATIKIIVAPPDDLPPMERARQAVKLIAAVVSASLGMLFEEAVKGFILSVPFLAPVAELVSGVVTGILTGLTTALVVYGIDRLFDALSDTGTAQLEARLAALDADADLVNQLSGYIEQQQRNSRLHHEIAHGNADILGHMRQGAQHSAQASAHAGATLRAWESTADTLRDTAQSMRAMDEELAMLLDNYQLENKP
ncbi:MAG: hypothetical protein ACREWI_12390 [Telluria sp.]